MTQAVLLPAGINNVKYLARILTLIVGFKIQNEMKKGHCIQNHLCSFYWKLFWSPLCSSTIICYIYTCVYIKQLFCSLVNTLTLPSIRPS